MTSTRQLGIINDKNGIVLKSAVTLICATVVAHIIGSLHFVHFSALKPYFEMIRAGCWSLALLIAAWKIRLGYGALCTGLFLGMLLVIHPTALGLHVLTVFLGAYVTVRLGTRVVLRSTAMAALIVMACILLLVKFGLIYPGPDYYNPLADVSAFVVGHKSSLGFWHGNAASAIISGILVAAFLARSKKLVLSAYLVYGYVLSEAVSRTYVIVPVAIALYLFVERCRLLKFSLVAFVFTVLGLLSTIVGIFFLMPSLFQMLVGEKSYQAIDVLLSYRLRLAEVALAGDRGLFSSGVLKPLYVDSVFLNIGINYSVILALLLFAFLFVVVLVGINRRLYRESAVLILLTLCANFENIINLGSLLGFSAIVALLNILMSKRLRCHRSEFNYCSWRRSYGIV